MLIGKTNMVQIICLLPLLCPMHNTPPPPPPRKEKSRHRCKHISEHLTLINCDNCRKYFHVKCCGVSHK